MADVTIKQGDRLPILSRQFLTDGAPTNLTGATVTFNLWNAASGVQVITNGTCTVTAAATGNVQYPWTGPDATLPVGVYLGSFTATFAGAVKLTAPNNGSIVVEVVAATGAVWSYTGDPSARPIDMVRFLSGDTDTSNQQATDSEVLFLLAEWNSDPYMAAAAVCDAAAGKASAKADGSKSVGDLTISTQYGQQAAAWTSRGASLRAQAARKNPPRPTADSAALGSFRFAVGQDEYGLSTQPGEGS